ncbi:MAG: sigma-70 family RNA polymerase sigma factor [Pirellulaceae bacterium]
MTEVSRILNLIEAGDLFAAEQLLPLVYSELRKLAAARLAKEKPGQTLQATALVHEAYLRLVDDNKDRQWNGKGHFFGAAAEAMRRILVDQARRKGSKRAGGDRKKIELSIAEPEATGKSLDMVALDEALNQLEQHDSRSCKVVKLRFFAGLTVPEAAEAVGVSVSTAENDWAYARSWLQRKLRDSEECQ